MVKVPVQPSHVPCHLSDADVSTTPSAAGEANEERGWFNPQRM